MSEAKKPRVEEEAAGEVLSDFGPFRLTRVLQERPERRMIALEGRFPEHGVHPAVVILDKTPFSKDTLQQILSSDTKLDLQFRNDVYGKYDCHIDSKLNLVKASVIYPATEKHLAKYASCPIHLVQETPQLYEAVTAPFLQGEKFSIDWVYNILEHKKEADVIVAEDPDPSTGFVMVPDYKWSGHQVEDLYMICIIMDRSVRSLRDLRPRHLPMLRNVWLKCSEAIGKKYQVPPSQLRAYFHYQPSYYHLHVHFSHLSYEAPGIKTERAHLLSTVIDNLERDTNYYAKATLPFVVRETENLFQCYKKAGYVFDIQESNGDLDCRLEGIFKFFECMGAAKHEPCGEHWEMSYGDSAWRMAVMCLCLPQDLDRKRLIKLALASAFTSMGRSTDHCSEWPEKLSEVRKLLFQYLPFTKAVELCELYSTHVNARRGLALDSHEERVYRKVVEFEEMLLQWEELKREGEVVTHETLLRKMSEVGFAGSFKYKVLNDKEDLEHLLTFFLRISVLCSLKRTGWVQNKVRDPERVAGHMFRMGILSLVLDEAPNDSRIFGGSSVIVSIIHDIAECIVGDITPNDGVAAEEKHEREMSAMRTLVAKLPDYVARDLYDGFRRYEESDGDDDSAVALTRDLDKFDMVLQAFEYEKAATDRPAHFLQSFFDSTKGVFTTKEVRRLVQFLHAKRDQK